MVYPDFQPFDGTDLEKLLELKPCPLLHAGKRPLRQIQYIKRYVRDLDCSALVVEKEYIDRDYMEDHSVFYSRSLKSYPNHCHRVHFFRNIDSKQLELEIPRIAAEFACSKESYQSACDKFSEAHYLGFMVVRSGGQFCGPTTESTRIPHGAGSFAVPSLIQFIC